MRSFELETGEIVIVQYALIDNDGINLQEGVDVFIEGDYVGSLLGLREEEVNENYILPLMI